MQRNHRRFALVPLLTPVTPNAGFSNPKLGGYREQEARAQGMAAFVQKPKPLAQILMSALGEPA